MKQNGGAAAAAEALTKTLEVEAQKTLGCCYTWSDRSGL